MDWEEGWQGGGPAARRPGKELFMASFAPNANMEAYMSFLPTPGASRAIPAAALSMHLFMHFIPSCLPQNTKTKL